MHNKCFRLGIISFWLLLCVVISFGVISYTPHTETQKDIPIIKQIQITPASKIIDSVDKYAWPDGTDSEKWDYDTGGFKNDE